MQVQLDVRSGVKLDLLEALVQVPHTGVYGLEVRWSALSLLHPHSVVVTDWLVPSLGACLTICACVVKAGQKDAILALIEQVEATNPLEAPTEHLEHCQGSWRLLFSTVTILVRSGALQLYLTG